MSDLIVFPVSHAQERLWFLDQLQGPSAVYNMPAALRLTGRLDVPALRWALRQIVARHESLRTTFRQVKGEPVQVVADTLTLSVQLVDVADEAKTRARIRKAVQEPFDLARGPLIRAELIRLAPQAHILFVNMHHIITDGWSQAVLVKDLAALYRSALIGRPRPLPELPIQYGDFAEWQRANTRQQEKQLSWWKENLKDLPPLLDLPGDRPRPPTQRYRGAVEPFALPKDQSEALNRLCREEDVTLFMLLLAAFSILLARYSGTTDLAIGSPVANRNNSDLESLIGFFVNTLVFRMDLHSNPGFRRLLEQTKTTVLGVFEHQDLPFERLVEALQPKRNLAWSPLFQVMLVLQSTPKVKMSLPGLVLEQIETGNRGSLFDLRFSITPGEQGLRGGLEYNSDIFDQNSITRMLTHFQTLLCAILENPGAPVHDLCMIPAAERTLQLDVWNQTKRDYPVSPLIHERFLQRAQETPETIALTFRNRVMTYADLERRVTALAHALETWGLEPEDSVALCLDRGPDLVIALLAVLCARGVYLPLDTRAPEQRTRRMLSEARPRLILTMTHAAPVFSDYDVICLDAFAYLAQPAFVRTSHPARGAYIIFTSGSTGHPKGVLISHEAILNRLLWMQDCFQIGAEDRILQKTPYTFDVSVWEFFWPLMAGARLVLAEPDGHRNPTYLARLIRDWGVTVMHMVPSMLGVFLEEPDIHQLRSLQRVICSGEALSSRLQALFFEAFPSVALWNLYGPTEATVDVSAWQADPENPDAPVYIGKPIHNIGLFILDSVLRPLPLGARGELFIGGVGLARGYCEKPALTAQRFVPHPFSNEPGRRLYQTGDIARFRDDGEIAYLGRKDRQLKIRGFRIEPGEIEQALGKDKRVRQSVVMPRKDGPDNPRLVAYIIPEPTALAHDTVDQDQMDEWTQLYDETYRTARDADPLNQFISWRDSDSGLPIPQAEMRAWADEIRDRILETRPKSVLELGCGVGLILFRLIDHLERIDASDLSRAAIEYLGRQLGERTSSVRLRHAAAHELDGFRDRRYDTIVLNSVVQYFSGPDYLTTVLERAADLVNTGGAIVIGDVRHLGLLRAFHAGVIRRRAKPGTNLDQLRRDLRNRMRHEKELVLHPYFFTRLKRRIPRIGHVVIQPKWAEADNEMSRYRYDVTLLLDVAEETKRPGSISKWRGLSHLRDRLSERPDFLYLTHIPNRRIADDLAYLHDLENGHTRRRSEREASPRQAPAMAELTTLARSLGYEAQPQWIPVKQDGSFTFLFSRCHAVGLPAMVEITAVSDELANAPSLIRREILLRKKLRESLGDALPEYMIPSAFVFLDRFPTTANGKLDRTRLPDPDDPTDTNTAYRAPEGITEKQIAAIWVEVLGAERVGARDNFFELGGHSLLATRVVSRIRKMLGLDLQVRDMFNAPTVHALAGLIEAGKVETNLDKTRQFDPKTIPAVAWQEHERLPSSFAQKRMWRLNRIEGPSTAFNMPLAVSLTGRISVPAIEASFREIQVRHQTLLSTFSEEDGEIFVRLRKENRDTPLIDIGGLADPETNARRLVNAHARLVFDLAQGPLIDLRLLRFSRNEHYLLINTHHVVSDGWSSILFIREFTTLYEAFNQGRPSPLPPPKRQYADFAAWQWDFFSSPNLMQGLQYWKNALGDNPPGLDLPTDFARPAVLSYKGGQAGLMLDRELSEALERLSVTNGCSLFMVLLSGFSLLLGRYAGQDDIVIGTPIAGRNHHDFEKVIGFFTNSLVIRTDLSGKNLSFVDLLQRVRRITLAAFEHQDIPFGKLAEEIQTERNNRFNPLFQVFFNMTNLDNLGTTLTGLEIKRLSFPDIDAKYDLTLYASENANGLGLSLSYKTDLYRATTAETLLDQLRFLYRQIVANPCAPISNYFIANPFAAAGRDHRSPIDPGQIENLLTTHDQVAEALVLVRQTDRGDALLVAYIRIADRGSPPDPEALRSWLKQRLPESQPPAAFVLLTAFPLTPEKDIDFKALPDPPLLIGDDGNDRETV